MLVEIAKHPTLENLSAVRLEEGATDPGDMTPSSVDIEEMPLMKALK